MTLQELHTETGQRIAEYRAFDVEARQVWANVEQILIQSAKLRAALEITQANLQRWMDEHPAEDSADWWKQQ